jgi:hypothetical protein
MTLEFNQKQVKLQNSPKIRIPFIFSIGLNRTRCEKQICNLTIKTGLFIELNCKIIVHSRCLIASSIFDKVDD